MKKIVLIFCLALLTAYSVNAQNFRFGLTASPVLSWFSVAGSDIESDGVRLGFQYGLLFEPEIGQVDRYVFSTGVIINMVGGYLFAEDAAANNYYSSIRAHYIEVPLTIKLRSNEINYMRYYGLFGITPGINIKARYDLEDGNGNLLVEDYDLKDGTSAGDKYKLFNLNLTLGLGAEYSLSETTTLTGGIFFQNGFTNVFKSSQTSEAIQLKQLGFRIAILF
ncbi:MAG: porin family protein [Chitinophagales bacterium]